ncbi:hypothetical protein BK120_23215 [Paenibacillus sp. FSL A5-0031]|uniref:hypothetical protein n=1 Tax=Paenibacillus sp. FSL A5-0031 TaxID=1920420 RepID=UPI00096BE078|nr:hypothetical protein [Paenibacillus sp. FSL A5-0031]OME78652.1 hypothetical protein BK120_23215 [Paenibacillus sp. FSL A5-0031]
MDKLIIPVVICIILFAAAFYMYNNPNGINDGINDGTQRVNTKSSTFDYSGTVGPGSSQTLPAG